MSCLIEARVHVERWVLCPLHHRPCVWLHTTMLATHSFLFLLLSSKNCISHLSPSFATHEYTWKKICEWAVWERFAISWGNSAPFWGLWRKRMGNIFRDALHWLSIALLQHCRTRRGFKWSKFRMSFFFIPWIFLPCQNLVPTLPAMQLYHWQLGQRFSRVYIEPGRSVEAAVVEQ